MPQYLRNFDPTSVSTANLVSAEIHTLSVATGLVVVTYGGLYYTKSLVVTQVLTTTVLNPGTDYIFIGFDTNVSAQTGFEVAAAIKIINTAISGNIAVTYQAVGGPEGEVSSFVMQLSDQINGLSQVTADWSDVANRPATYPPVPHTHDFVTDLTGLAALRNVLSKIYVALTDARVPTLSSNALIQKTDRLLALIATQRMDLNNLSARFGDFVLNSTASPPATPITINTIQSYITAAVNTAISSLNLVTGAALSATLSNYVLKSGLLNGTITGVGPEFQIINGVLRLAIEAEITNFTSSVLAVEIGNILNNFTLSWGLTSPMTSLILNNGIGAISNTATSYTVVGANLNSNTTYTIVGNDGSHDPQSSVTISFLPSVYWGVNASSTLTSAQIVALGNSTLATNYVNSVTYNCTGGAYPYFAYPSSYGTPTNVTINTAAGNLKFSDFTVSVVSVTNSFGYTQNYNVLRFNNLQTGPAILVSWK